MRAHSDTQLGLLIWTLKWHLLRSSRPNGLIFPLLLTLSLCLTHTSLTHSLSLDCFCYVLSCLVLYSMIRRCVYMRWHDITTNIIYVYTIVIVFTPSLVDCRLSSALILAVRICALRLWHTFILSFINILFCLPYDGVCLRFRFFRSRVITWTQSSRNVPFCSDSVEYDSTVSCYCCARQSQGKQKGSSPLFFVRSQLNE